MSWFNRSEYIYNHHIPSTCAEHVLLILWLMYSKLSGEGFLAGGNDPAVIPEEIQKVIFSEYNKIYAVSTISEVLRKNGELFIMYDDVVNSRRRKHFIPRKIELEDCLATMGFISLKNKVIRL